MKNPAWPAALAAGALLLGLSLLLAGRGMRQWRGLSGGETVSLDRVTLTSPRYGLTGRPDRLIRIGGTVIPEEWKSSRRLRPWRRVQVGVYFLLVEDQLGVFLVCGDGTRHQIENDDALRVWVLSLVAQIRSARAAVSKAIPVRPMPRQCRPCGMRGHCGQARP